MSAAVPALGVSFEGYTVSRMPLKSIDKAAIACLSSHGAHSRLVVASHKSVLIEHLTGLSARLGAMDVGAPFEFYSFYSDEFIAGDSKISVEEEGLVVDTKLVESIARRILGEFDGDVLKERFGISGAQKLLLVTTNEHPYLGGQFKVGGVAAYVDYVLTMMDGEVEGVDVKPMLLTPAYSREEATFQESLERLPDFQAGKISVKSKFILSTAAGRFRLFVIEDKGKRVIFFEPEDADARKTYVLGKPKNNVQTSPYDDVSPITRSNQFDRDTAAIGRVIFDLISDNFLMFLANNFGGALHYLDGHVPAGCVQHTIRSDGGTSERDVDPVSGRRRLTADGVVPLLRGLDSKTGTFFPLTPEAVEIVKEHVSDLSDQRKMALTFKERQGGVSINITPGNIRGNFNILKNPTIQRLAKAYGVELIEASIPRLKQAAKHEFGIRLERLKRLSRELGSVSDLESKQVIIRSYCLEVALPVESSESFFQGIEAFSHALSDCHFDPEKPMGLYICRLHPEKGPELYDTMLQQFKDRDWNFVFAGLMAASDDDMVGDVRFPDFLEDLFSKHSETPFLIGIPIQKFLGLGDLARAAADIFVNTSKHEQAPISLLEQMTMGTYIVATDVFGTKSILFQTDGEIDESVNRLVPVIWKPNEKLTQGWKVEETRESFRQTVALSIADFEAGLIDPRQIYDRTMTREPIREVLFRRSFIDAAIYSRAKCAQFERMRPVLAEIEDIESDADVESAAAAVADADSVAGDDYGDADSGDFEF